jgi:hypothetical protein
VKGLVDFAQLAVGNVGVNLSGGDAFVAEEIADA